MHDVSRVAMAWRGPRTGNDPLLTGHAWRTTIRGHWIQLRLPCSRCGRAIDYDGLRYLANGLHHRRCQGGQCLGCLTLNPRYLIVGHRVSRYQARRLGWTEQQVNAISNTQPECQDCSNRSGAQLGQKIQNRRRRQAVSLAANAERW